MISKDVKKDMAVLIPEWIRARQDIGRVRGSLRNSGTFDADNAGRVTDTITYSSINYAIVEWRSKLLMIAVAELLPFRLHRSCVTCTCDPFPQQEIGEDDEDDEDDEDEDNL